MLENGRLSKRVTIVFLQGDRFNVAQDSLQSLFDNTPEPYELVCVDGGSPAPVRDFLRRESEARGFKLIRSERYLTPNQARNLGMRGATSDYIVFLENDVIVAPGWLGPLITCAEETGAAAVVPLTCENLPLHSIVHHAGGEFAPLDEIESFLAPRTQGAPLRVLRPKIYLHRQPISEVGPGLVRERTGSFERHCVLMRREMLDRIGPLDEKMLATREHFDASMAIWRAGGEIWFEPRAVATFLTPDARPLSRSDLEYFSLRWSDDWQRRSLEHFRKKWELESNPDVDYSRMRLNWRRRQAIIRPVVTRLPLIGRSYHLARALEWLAQPLERLLNRWYVARYERS